MDPERASKRRRLDTPDTTTERSTPDTQRNTSSTAPRGGRVVSRIEHLGNDDSNSVSSSQSAQDAWREAKAKQRAFKQIKGRVVSERDVYDDIDGAHPSPPRKPATTVKKKPSVDPLRNQRNDPASSPLKKATGGTGSFGFFKQFQKPKVETKSRKPKSQIVHNGESRQDTQKSPEISESSEDSSADELARDTPASAPVRARGRPRNERQSNGTQAGKGWVTENGSEPQSGGRKKTFEDEIKELEEAAKKKADDEGPEKLAAHPRRRRSGVQSVKEKENKASTKQPNVSVSSQPRAKSSGKRATSQVDHSETNENTNVTKHVDTEKATTTPSTPSKGKLQPTPKVHQTQPPAATFEPDELSSIQHALLERLTNKTPVPLTSLEDEYAKVSQVITQTVTASESNSILLIGARGSGKTALVNQILREQAAEHTEDFHVVRLNGFVHTDDKIALRDTWRQLGREMELDENEQGTAGKNYADTLASLLALLSHPAEQGREEAQDQVTKSVIFILDEFDLFASHPRQTLLYNLFDIAQSRKAPIAVLGLTTRVDVSESLEKRVKSRFSHRYVHLSLPKSFPAFVAACKAVVTFPENHPSVVKDGLKKWQDTVEALFSEEGMQTHLRRMYYTTKSISDFMASLLVPTAATFTADAPTSSTTLLEHFLHAIRSPTLRAPDSKLDILAVLSTLQLALLICAARLSAIYATDIVSFNLAYEEYKVLGSKARLQASASGALSAGASARVSGKEIARDAWAELISMGLVMMEPGGRGGRVDVGLEEIGMSGVDLGTWGRWCREI
ncbi:origin recognition complex, subunit 4 [Hortaea werneckii]|nr:origin recognition complex, subunit 4 [Hortaea werneckii]